jgi:hypothetical protein
MQEITADHNSRSSFARLAMNNSNVLLILLKPFCYVVTEWFNVIKLWRMMIIKWKVSDASIKLGRVVNALRAQVINFKVVL